MASHEVGLSVDFENVRYGLINNFGIEPDPALLMEKARKYGPVAVANAYADFAQHPPILRRKLEVAGISPRDVPRRSPDVVHKSSADMAMLIDIIDCLLDQPQVRVLVLMTGDSDFIRVTTRARYRFDKLVVIAGVPGSVSGDLIESADLYDPLIDESRYGQPAPVDGEAELRLLQLILWLNERRPYMTFGFLRTHAMSEHHDLGLDEDQVTDLLSRLKDRDILMETYRTSNDGRSLRTLELNSDHERVQEVKGIEPPEFHDGPREFETAESHVEFV